MKTMCIIKFIKYAFYYLYNKFVTKLLIIYIPYLWTKYLMFASFHPFALKTHGYAADQLCNASTFIAWLHCVGSRMTYQFFKSVK